MSEKVENHDAFVHKLYEVSATRARLKRYIKRYKIKKNKGN
jgi:hypothetical protein